MNSKTFYDILNINSDATQDDVKRAYQQLALQHHPDKANEEDSVKFIELGEAWKTLRDPEKRKQYDAELRQSEFADRPIVHETLKKTDFTFDEDTQVYSHNCRCGGTYIMPDDEELQSEANYSIYIACDECSLVIELEKG